MGNSYHELCSPGEKGGGLGGKLWFCLCRKALHHSHRAGLMGVNLGDPEAHECAGGDGGMLPSSWGIWSPGHPSNTALSPRELQGEPKAGAWCVSCGKCPAKVSQ